MIALGNEDTFLVSTTAMISTGGKSQKALISLNWSLSNTFLNKIRMLEFNCNLVENKDLAANKNFVKNKDLIEKKNLVKCKDNVKVI